MNRSTNTPARATAPLVRCAVYTRKSTEEGLEQEFNSLDAQREAGEAFVRSQQQEGWTCLPERYDDGGFTGGNMERPALQRLLADIAAGKIDCVIVYKLDRLSRSLLDFARIMETFERAKVSFVSVTQQFNSGTSMGRLLLNVLLSFAQFEREIIAERTRDKIVATRRKGKWTGGTPLLGYDLEPRGGRLIVNEEEAVPVRAIFALYLEHAALLSVVQELERRGWTTKRWVTKAGRVRGGRQFNKTNLCHLLKNVAYLGQVRYKDEVHDGEHPALVDPAIFQQVRMLLQRKAVERRTAPGHPGRSLLRGRLRCRPCGCAMTPSYSGRGGKRYRYYTCINAQKRGWDACPSKSIPAAAIEQFVVDQVRDLGRDPHLLAAVLSLAQQQDEARLGELDAEERSLEHELTRWQHEAQRLSAQFRSSGSDDGVVSRLTDLQERIAEVEKRTAKVREQMHDLRQQRLEENKASESLSRFDPVWGMKTPQEQARLIELLVQRVEYDGSRGKVAIRFQPTGIKALADELARLQEEQSA
jgi:site-specific DNA recombinase